MEKSKMSMITIEVDREMYFQMLQCCLDRKETIDEFVTAALKNIIKIYDEKTKKKRKSC